VTTALNTSHAVDWDLARKVAARVAGREPLERSYLAGGLREDFHEATTRADSLVSEHTGLVSLSGPATGEVIDRAGWIDANVAGFQRVLAPVSERLADAASGLVRRGGRVVVGAELGVLLGFLSRRVLGQYDLFLPESPGGTVYYVGPNVLSLEARFRFRPGPFRLWIALHEVTHRAQFTGVPWMKAYFLSLIDETLSGLEPDPRRLFEALLRAVETLRKGGDPLAEGGVVGLFATDEQRATLTKVQSLMCLLEGHGNFVMDRIGATHVPDQARMSATLRARRQAGGAQRLFYRISGMEMKVQQYELGERFVTAVEQEAGPRALDAVWQSPDNLPTMDEIRNPETWLRRC
jgi:coenzyme F420 biosynthesis associated uncharacterized protein